MLSKRRRSGSLSILRSRQAWGSSANSGGITMESQKRGLKLAAVVGSKAGDGDRFLSQIARDLVARGLRVGGVVQSNPPQPDQSRCAMVLEELTTASKIQISQKLGKGGTRLPS